MIKVGDAKVLVGSILGLTILTNVTKAFLGGQANAIVDVVFLAMVGLLVLQDRIRYSKLIVLFTAYVVGHAIGQLMSYGGLLGPQNYTDYRNLVRGGIMVLLLLNTDFKSTAQINSFFLKLLGVVAVVAIADIYAEFFAYKVLHWDLRSLPYVQAAYGDVVTSYGNPASDSRIPTMLGSPHFFGLTQASLVFVFWHMYNQGLPTRWLTVATLVSVLFVESRLQIFVVVGVIAMHYAARVRLSGRSLTAAAISAVALIWAVDRFGSAFVLGTSPMFRLALDLFQTYGTLDVLRELIVLPRSNEMYKLLFGVGGVTGSEQYGELLSIADIEVGLIVELIPRYGAILVVLYFALTVRLFLQLRKLGHGVLSYALVPFIAAPVHMWLVNQTFVSDIFFAVVAYALVVIRWSKRANAASRAPTALPVAFQGKPLAEAER